MTTPPFPSAVGGRLDHLEALRPALRIGDRAPDFELPDASGRLYRLSDFRGSPVVLAFNPASWDPVRAECVETYNRLIARLPGLAGTRLLSIAGDGPWRELTFADAALTIPMLTGDTGALARRYGVADVPAVFVIDHEGVIHWRHVGAADALPPPDDVARALAALAERGRGAEMHRDGAARAAPLADAADAETTSASGAWTRREFVATALAASVALALTPLVARAEPVAHAAAAVPPIGAAVPVTLRVNGHDVSLSLEPRVTLLDALREYAGLQGSKKGCDHGQCGACTVHVDGRRMLSCLTFAVMQQGKSITTIEGLAESVGAAGDALHPMQQAFLVHDGFQCGYCTPGQIMSASAMTKEPWGPDDTDVREAMSGNICRCGAYPGIVAAIQEVRKGRSTASSDGPPAR